MEAHLVFQSRYSNKFWKISVAKNSLAVIYGRIGTGGTTRVKDFPSPEACKKEAHRLIQSKLKKGYQPFIPSQQEIEESAMTESYFWQLIDECKNHADDAHGPLDWLVSRLSGKSVTDIISFDSFLNDHYGKSNRRELRAAASIAMGGCSDDSFDSFRAWMFGLGKEAYYKAIEDPETLLPYLKLLKEQQEVPQLEGLLAVPSGAYAAKTGGGIDEYMKLYDQLMKEDWSVPDSGLDWVEEDEESLRQLLPKLWMAFGENPL
ncbi:DUF4240 domain-containing protein [Planomicrobium sp. CPCC 101079]|uniref:DUF4240 domain-containing protein n=1 Tax=Planomicrobium sp. CPCC 101079 TaxID=2599618 RepID=UPI0011B426D2|nr:DUF4240 domain-containing protein [Planomicrobium sp. CPCC 101079]TWT13153.1 DUF4240 domain-containing protein [Planomicrobium sp. CPCC 101079]